MPLIKRGPTGTLPADAAASADALPQQLTTGNTNERWSAARALGEQPNAVPLLATALETEKAPEVREAIFTSLVLIRTPMAADALARLIRSDDAYLRAGALDALGAMIDLARPLLPGLLTDGDPDVRLLSCELVRSLEPEDGTRLLCDAFNDEQQANVCAAAVDVLSEIGTASALPFLSEAAVRFQSDSYLRFAITDATERISQRPARDG